MRRVAGTSLEKCKNTRDWAKIKAMLKDDIGEFLWKEIKRTPVILPIIMEI
ncbi:hypothetical protein RZO55_10885 [Clostridium boliviensis]|uniref:Ribonuclease J C-terminal domain-containing protein n=1 Tax=Clostridium boliviensis TaxID=318465 RepID=A0ABU4GJP7_9CLOT|nr:hypothetical protein [Clostridium boliviensis]MDW2797212.1 hypothetical protein [Clostridium boliviensis]MDW2798080.1 hypothetical protein [Clostridium boliviensis]